MLGYKSACAYNKLVVITLEIPEDALTNLERKNVAVKESAKFRCNKAKVLKIEDEDGKEYEEAVSHHNGKYIDLIYKLNQTVSVHRFEMRLEEVCASGIHFFLTKRVAELYGRDKIQDGLYTKWYDNGSKHEECTYKNGKKNGLYTEWYENGYKIHECTYENDIRQGICTEWYINGQKASECVLENGKKNGSYTQWHPNGMKKKECTYLNDQTIGSSKEWNENGSLIKDVNHIILDKSQYEQCCVIS